jgi:hypothetical protein
MVHVRSQERHRHSVNVLMTFASVPTIRPLQKGQVVGRSTMPSRGSNIVFSLPTCLSNQCVFRRQLRGAREVVGILAAHPAEFAVGCASR